MTARKPRATTPAPSRELEELSAQASSLLAAVERGDLEVDDATGRRVVEAWRILAAGASIPQSVGAQRDPAAAERASELAAILAIEATNEDNA
jgi:hypothetical protein